MIIANLPIVNFDAGDNPINNALYDKDLSLHRRLFAEAKEYLAKDGIITFTHANLQSAGSADASYDFRILEQIVIEHGYEIIEKITKEDIGYTWINYKIRLKKLHE